VRRTLQHALAQVGPAGSSPAAEGGGAGDTPVLVAWSGGPDSAALLGLVELLARPLRLAIVVGHVDHGLRPASADEAALVDRVARARGHDVRSTRLALTPGPGLPARARDARRAALRAAAESVGAPFVLLGHTATDQVETMLLHACRGAGLGGLSAMASFEPDRGEKHEGAARRSPTWDPSHPALLGWLRPLLHLERTHTRMLAEALDIPFVDDPTNADPSHPRIAIRDGVLPILRTVNPEFEAHFGALARTARDAEQAIAIAAEAWMERVHGVGSQDLDAHALAAAPRAVRAAVVRTFCERRGVPPDALHERTLAAIDAVVAGVAAEPGRTRRWDLFPHRTLWLQGGRLRIEAGAEEDGDAAADPLRPGPNH
jgi:tRNA(Ile)-lysidine synthase